MIEVIDLPFAEAKEMVTCQASEDKIENYDATFLFLIYWFLYNKESYVIRNRFPEIVGDIRMRHTTQSATHQSRSYTEQKVQGFGLHGTWYRVLILVHWWVSGLVLKRC